MKYIFAAGFLLGAILISSPRSYAQVRAQYCCASLATPTPTAAPAVYIYHGVQVYNGTAGVPDPQANADISAATIDTNSATIISNLSASITFDNGSEASDLRANLAASPSPVPTGIQTSNPAGHNPPFSTPAPASVVGTIPWAAGFFIQGTCTTNCQGSSDAHCIVLDTNTQFVYQGGGCDHFATGGAWFSAFNGYTDDLHNTYCSQQANKGDNVTVAGIPLLGFTVFGEDMTAAASGTPIAHPSSVIVPVSAVHSGTAAVNLSTLTTNSVGTCAGNATTQCLKFGDILRLKSTFNCPGLSTAKAQAWCVSLQKYGAVVNDLGSQPVFRFGLDSSGVDDVDAATIAFQHSLTLSANFDIITRGTVHC